MSKKKQVKKIAAGAKWGITTYEKIFCVCHFFLKIKIPAKTCYE